MKISKKLAKEIILDILKHIHDWKYMEYIYLDNNELYNEDISDLNDALFILNKNNTLIIKDPKYYDEVISETPKVDLMILEEDLTLPVIKLNEMINENTIISKIFDNEVLYIEDQLKDEKILITDKQTFYIDGEGINTQISIK